MGGAKAEGRGLTECAVSPWTTSPIPGGDKATIEASRCLRTECYAPVWPIPRCGTSRARSNVETECMGKGSAPTHGRTKEERDAGDAGGETKSHTEREGREGRSSSPEQGGPAAAGGRRSTNCSGKPPEAVPGSTMERCSASVGR